MHIIRQVPRARSASLALIGELDMANADLLAQHVTETLAEIRPTELIIDAAGLEFCDSVGVSALMRACEAARSQGSTFRLINVSEMARRILRITGVLDVLTT
jgi:anti-anti-sigma factor